jgi:hypothetical protein
MKYVVAMGDDAVAVVVCCAAVEGFSSVDMTSACEIFRFFAGGDSSCLIVETCPSIST